MGDIADFERMKKESIERMGSDSAFRAQSLNWLNESAKHKYSYHFSWLGLPVIQYPEDLVALQEIVWAVQPDVIVETGIARGGSLVFYASLLKLLGKNGLVIGIDVDIRPHNRAAIDAHALRSGIAMVEGSSISRQVVDEVARLARGRGRVLVVLDSNHTEAHVLQELELYSPLVTKDCYLVVFDTLIDDMPDDLVQNRPWGRGNNPKTAVREFLQRRDRFVIDKEIEHKLLITVAPDGYLKCIKD